MEAPGPAEVAQASVVIQYYVILKYNREIKNPCSMPPMSGRRSYADGCAAAHALDLIGERWALLVVRELLLGPKRFTDLRAGLIGVSPNVLSQRLLDLEAKGLLRRLKLPPPAAAWVYQLTDWGRELETVIVEMGRWGARSPQRPAEAHLGSDSLVLSFRTMFSAERARDFSASIELRLGEDRFHAEVREGVFQIARGTASKPDSIVIAPPAALARVAYHELPLADAIQAGDIAVQGSTAVADRFLHLFPLPPLAAPAQTDLPAL